MFPIKNEYGQWDKNQWTNSFGEVMCLVEYNRKTDSGQEGAWGSAATWEETDLCCDDCILLVMEVNGWFHCKWEEMEQFIILKVLQVDVLNTMWI